MGFSLFGGNQNKDFSILGSLYLGESSLWIFGLKARSYGFME